MTIKFYKEESGRWYADLPFFSKEELEMVAGADVFLDIIAQGENGTSLWLSESPFEGANKLEKLDETPETGGATYFVGSYKGIDYNMVIWLCDVTREVFDCLPDTIYYS